MEKKKELLDAAWALRLWLEDHGVPHSVAFLETRSGHFEGSGSKKAEGTGCEKAKCELVNGEPREPEDDNGKPINDLSWVHWALGERIRTRKDAKSGGDARPRCSLFASCGLHGGEPANHSGDDVDARRRLVGWRAACKKKNWIEQRDRLSGQQSKRRKPTYDVSDFTRGGDSYIAYACGDGDGMGDLLSNLHWNDSAWGDGGRKAWQRNRDFSKQFDRLVRKSFAEALRAAAVEEGETVEGLFQPHLLGGDDLWLVGEKQSVLALCQAFVSKYEELAQGDQEFGTLQKALDVAKKPSNGQGLRFTVSMGVAFVKASHPMNDNIAVAESLMKSAKKLRKREVPAERKAPNSYMGCIDWHWVESSKSEEIKDARAKGWMYNGTKDEVMLLTTRPWTHEETKKFREAAETFHKVPRRKREQLEQILRMGKTLGDLAWKSWWDGLGDARGTVKATVEKLCVWKPADVSASPWVEFEGGKVYATPFLDILALQHVLGLESSEQEVHS